MNQSKDSWETEFNKEFVVYISHSGNPVEGTETLRPFGIDHYKNFIRKVEAEAEQRGKKEERKDCVDFLKRLRDIATITKDVLMFTELNNVIEQTEPNQEKE